MGMSVNGLALIFSLKDGDVWASRLDGRPPLLLGPYDEVIAAMHDFIGQADFAERLLNKAASNKDARA
jgi:hypothetical protein